MEANTNCKNCETPVESYYCHDCGQRTSVHRVTLKETFSDVASGLLSFEAPFWITLKLLFSNPGVLFRDYLSGRRKSYFKPVSFFILLTVVHILVRTLIDYDPMDSLIEEPDAKVHFFKEAGQFMVQHINNILFIFVFTLSLFMKVFFFKEYNWAEYIAIAFYLVGIYIFLGTINVFFLKYLNTGMQFLTMGIMLIYFVYAMVSLIQKKKLWVSFKSIWAYVLGTLFYVVLGFGFSLIIVSLT